ncbi:hypothetical protein AB0C21_18940 [Spirillospora sp. NPDC049024]
MRSSSERGRPRRVIGGRGVRMAAVARRAASTTGHRARVPGRAAAAAAAR